MLAFLRVETGGHFVLIRPVGHTGRLLQVVNADQSPTLIDRVDLARSHQWTGHLLAPTRRSQMAMGGTVAGSLAVLSATGAFVRRIRRRNRLT